MRNDRMTDKVQPNMGQRLGELAQALEVARDGLVKAAEHIEKLDGDCKAYKGALEVAVAAMNNLENDDKHMPPSVWSLIQGAIVIAREALKR